MSAKEEIQWWDQRKPGLRAKKRKHQALSPQGGLEAKKLLTENCDNGREKLLN